MIGLPCFCGILLYYSFPIGGSSASLQENHARCCRIRSFSSGRLQGRFPAIFGKDSSLKFAYCHFFWCFCADLAQWPFPFPVYWRILLQELTEHPAAVCCIVRSFYLYFSAFEASFSRGSFCYSAVFSRLLSSASDAKAFSFSFVAAVSGNISLNRLIFRHISCRKPDLTAVCCNTDTDPSALCGNLLTCEGTYVFRSTSCWKVHLWITVIIIHSNDHSYAFQISCKGKLTVCKSQFCVGTVSLMQEFPGGPFRGARQCSTGFFVAASHNR